MGTVTRHASAMRQSMSAIHTAMAAASSTLPESSGIMCASGTSTPSMRSTNTFLIWPMLFDAAVPREVFMSFSTTSSRSDSRMVYADTCESSVDAPNSTFDAT